MLLNPAAFPFFVNTQPDHPTRAELFAAIVADCTIQILMIAKKRLQNEHLANDVVQDVFALVWSKKYDLKYHNAPEQLKKCMSKATTLICYAIARKEQKFAEPSLDDLENELSLKGYFERITDEYQDLAICPSDELGLEMAADIHMMDLIEQAKLSCNERVVWLAWFAAGENWNSGDYSRKYAMKEGTVRKNLCISKRKMRAAWGSAQAGRNDHE